MATGKIYGVLLRWNSARKLLSAAVVRKLVIDTEMVVEKAQEDGAEGIAVRLTLRLS